MKRFLVLLLPLLLGTVLAAQTDTTVYHGPKYPPLPPGMERDTTIAPDPFEYDKAPEFPGGPNEMYRFFAVNVHYPQLEKEKGISGTVFIRFVVEPNGTITNISAVHEVEDAPGLTREAMRVISMMPHWKPAQKNGKPVRGEVVIPVKFKLQ